MTQHFCAYVHFKPDMTPFYVGKGSVKRAHDLKPKKRNDWHGRVVAKYGAENIIIETMPCKSEAEAFLRESLAIKALKITGAKLCNMTDGGEGTSGSKHNLGKKHTKEQNEQNRLRLKGNKFAAGKRTAEQKARIAAAIWESNKNPQVIANKAAGSIGNTNASGTRSNEFCATMKIKSRGNKNACGKRTPEQRARMSAGRLAAKLKGATP